MMFVDKSSINSIEEMYDAIFAEPLNNPWWMTDDLAQLNYLDILEDMKLVIRQDHEPEHVCSSDCFNCSYNFRAVRQLK